MNFENIEVGHTVAIHRHVTPGDVAIFMALCDDINPVHKDDEIARSMGYPRRIVHGMLVASYTPVLVGMLDVAAVCVHQSFDWLQYILVDDELDIVMTVTHKSHGLRALGTKITVTNQNDFAVMTGKGVIVVPRTD